jgi:hypothetical protein
MSGRGSKRKTKAPESLLARLDKTADDKKESASVARATRESKREAYSAFESELLYWWGYQLKKWPVRAVDAAKRDLVLDELIKADDLDVPTLKELKDNYKLRTERPYQGDGRHHAADEEEASSDSDNDEEEHKSATAPGARANPSTPSKKRKVTHVVRTADAEHCPHCLQPNTAPFCALCGLRGDQPWESPQNTSIRANRGTATADTRPSTSSRRDRELERLAAADGPFPRFDGRQACSAEEAFKILRGAYMATIYEPPSKALINLVQSGKLTALGYAVPRLIADVESGKSTDAVTATLALNADSTVKATETAHAPRLQSMQQYMQAMFGTVIPALIAQPQALMDWCALTRTLLRLDEEGGWHQASAYLQRALTLKVMLREPFGEYDRSTLDSVKHEARPAAFARSSSAPMPAAARPMAPDDTMPCYHFNRGSCNKGDACPRPHVCSWRGCSAPKGHTITTCPDRPKREAPGSGSRPNVTFNTTRRPPASSFFKQGEGGTMPRLE